MEPKEWIEYLFIHFLCLKALNVHTTSWTAQVPQNVSAMQGSCVVVPCTFNYPEPEKKRSDLTGIWHTVSFTNIYHPDSSKVMDGFKGRTELIGDIEKKNCSLKINHLKTSDNGPFIFRIVINDIDKYSYSNEKVSIHVQDSPASPTLTVSEPVLAGKAVFASCSVSHSCPSDPPHLTWSHTGTPTVQSEQLTDGQWRLTSTVIFTSTISDHNKRLTCTAEYQQHKSVQRSKVLNVRYAPVNVRVEIESAVEEGDAVEMRCSSNSNPTTHNYQWYNVTGNLQSQGNIYKLQNVSRNIEAFYCTAINSEGRMNSTLVKINVEYVPEIKVGSACTTQTTGVTCLCIVDSEPPAEIKWLFPERAFPSSSTEQHSSLTLGTLRSTERLSDRVTCHASNTRGNTTTTFSLPQSDTLLYSLIPAAAVLLVAATVVVVWLMRRKRSNHNQPVIGMKDVDTTVEKASYSTTSRKKERSSNAGVYIDNQQIYGNIEVGVDGDVYACVEDATYANV